MINHARKDALERLYQPQAEIFVQTKYEAIPDILSWGLEAIIKEHPWKDSILSESTDSIGVYIGDVSATFERDSNCRFMWDQNYKCFRLKYDIPIRRGQMLVLENWVQMLVKELAQKSLPNTIITGVRGTVSFLRQIPEIRNAI